MWIETAITEVQQNNIEFAQDLINLRIKVIEQHFTDTNLSFTSANPHIL